MIPESKYQPIVDEMMKKLAPKGVVLVILGGKEGSGAASTIERRSTRAMAAILHGLAKDLESGNPGNISRVDVVK